MLSEGCSSSPRPAATYGTGAKVAGSAGRDGVALRDFLEVLRGSLVEPSAVPDSSLMQFHSLSEASVSVPYMHAHTAQAPPKLTRTPLILLIPFSNQGAKSP